MATAIKDGKEVALGKYGCFNRQPYKDEVMGWVPEITPDGYKLLKWGVIYINRASKDCRYDRQHTDERCAGCKWIKLDES